VIQQATLRLALALLLVCMVLVGAAVVSGAGNNADLLAYVANEGEENAIIIHDLSLNVWGRLIDGATTIEYPTWSGNGELAFYSFRENVGEINVWDGRELITIFNSVTPYVQLTWGSDGRLAFVSDRDGNREVYVWDGVNLVNISQSLSGDDSPAWSSDGQLAFVSGRDGNGEIYVWDGVNLVNISQSLSGDDSPAWSSDGRLAFVSDRDGNKDVYVWDGATVTNISQTLINDGAPVWSVDGRLAFASAGDGGMVYIWDGNTLSSSWLGEAMLLSGWSLKEQLALTLLWNAEQRVYFSEGETFVDVGYWSTSPAWATDGRLAFSGRSDNNFDIYIWNGREATNITRTPAVQEWVPVWMP
jgi:Tol biopolymer transport system component